MDNKNCAECNYRLFTHYNYTHKKYYCQLCNPDRVHQIREIHIREIPIDEKRNKEIEKLKRKYKYLKRQ